MRIAITCLALMLMAGPVMASASDDFVGTYAFKATEPCGNISGYAEAHVSIKRGPLNLEGGPHLVSIEYNSCSHTAGFEGVGFIKNGIMTAIPLPITQDAYDLPEYKECKIEIRQVGSTSISLHEQANTKCDRIFMGGTVIHIDSISKIDE